ncbi:hypothetical protein BC828DRAFT_139542 [Blastocladiella britannica]|nr:hypothetical protein BC828DRAFT_139542 [Blastocladiella britannica]
MITALALSLNPSYSPHFYSVRPSAMDSIDFVRDKAIEFADMVTAAYRQGLAAFEATNPHDKKVFSPFFLTEEFKAFEAVPNKFAENIGMYVDIRRGQGATPNEISNELHMLRNAFAELKKVAPRDLMAHHLALTIAATRALLDKDARILAPLPPLPPTPPTTVEDFKKVVKPFTGAETDNADKYARSLQEYLVRFFRLASGTTHQPGALLIACQLFTSPTLRGFMTGLKPGDTRSDIMERFLGGTSIKAFRAFRCSALVYAGPQDTTNFAAAYPAWYELLELYDSTRRGTEEHAFQSSLPLLAIEFDQAFKSQAVDTFLEHTLGTKKHSPAMSSLVALECDPTGSLRGVFTHPVFAEAIWKG